MNGSFECFQLATTNDELRELLYTDDAQEPFDNYIDLINANYELHIENETLKGEIFQSDNQIKILKEELIVLKNYYDTAIQDKDQFHSTINSMTIEIKKLKLQTMQLEIELRQKDIEIYRLKINELTQTL